MEQHGKMLAAAHKLRAKQTADRLLARLAENEAIITSTCSSLTEAVKANRRITPAGEWLLDNFYLIEEQIRTAKRHLPRGYSSELPQLASGDSAGAPRVYDIALATISHGDGHIDPENLSRFAAAYQSVTPLNLGELWAIPIMLRLALLENLRRVSARISMHMTDRELAGSWADKMIDMATNNPKSLILVVADMARSEPPTTSSFVSELVRRLQGQSAALALGLTWVEQRLSETSQSTDQLVQIETQQQAADQVSISNSIGSLRALDAMNWRNFVEAQSVVQEVLLTDPQRHFGEMDFGTRDRYRHVVEKLAKVSGRSEAEVARFAIKLAEDAEARVHSCRASHVGYFLVDAGLGQLKRAISYQSWSSDFAELLKRRPLTFYAGSILALTVLITDLLTQLVLRHPPANDLLLAMVCLSLLLCANQMAVSLVNWLATMLVPSHPLPKMDYSTGIPNKAKTLVVVPTMLGSREDGTNLADSLEVRFLANRDANLKFALLTDFLDSSESQKPDDQALLNHLEGKIKELNETYRSSTGDIFFFFHRPRLWNSSEHTWMGYERKRGKLAELNSLLRGGSGEGFSLIVGNTEALTGTKYVITLDTDTQLPREAAQKFVGALAHPLNQACLDERRGLVTQGYGILQPRVSVSLPCTNRSRYAALNGNDAGIDPYTRTVSDVYQDIFGEGSFIGKGIYDIDAVESTLRNRFPENRILSHDLLEGCYARSGLLSDVQLYEDYPSSYDADVARRHRWIRGDWQLISWLTPRPPGASGTTQNPLSLLSLWKLFDNLRRSLVPAALTALFIFGWTILSPPWLWTLATLSVVLIQPLAFAVLSFVRKPEDTQYGQHLSLALEAAVRSFVQAIFTVVCLPYEAAYSLDAIARTLFRVYISHKRLLAWRSSSESERSRRGDLLGFCLKMLFAPTLSTAIFFYLIRFRPSALPVAAPLLLLWFASPAMAWWLSKPLSPHLARLDEKQQLFLRQVARRTWAFFDTFVTAEENWLPPDNFQEAPPVGIAHRTSPTNMGLSLLANLTAHDFGYITGGQLLQRTTDTLATMHRLERYRGHLYNWYDTSTLLPLRPLYVSTVDSGNLAGHLLTLSAGLEELLDQKIFSPQIFSGLLDTLTNLLDTSPASVQARTMSETLRRILNSPPDNLRELYQTFLNLYQDAEKLLSEIAAYKREEGTFWATALKHQTAANLSELLQLAPWVGLAQKTIQEEIDTTKRQEPLRQSDSTNLKTNGKRGGDTSGGKTSKSGSTRQTLTGIVPLFTGKVPEFAGIPSLRQLAALEGGAGILAREHIEALNNAILQANDLANIEYDFLYEKGKRLLAIGFNADERRLDTSYYDLLASEARLCNFVAIAQNRLPQESWFSLGRLLTSAGGESLLLSWSGSMFEYLMPLLVMPSYEHTLLDKTCAAAVQRQIEYGKQRNIPWGISESGYYAVDVHLNYQYRAFGVPGLGLKRGLAQDLVITPYATALALMVKPEEACLNLERLAKEGFLSQYGFYEAIDYTTSRLPRGSNHAVIKSFMAHHQGMTFLSLAYLLLNRPMQRRFESNPAFKSTTLLLQERVPKATEFRAQTAQTSELRTSVSGDEAPLRFINNPDTPTPEVQLLSNGRYHVMVTSGGGGYSLWKELALTRFREDRTADNWGSFCYLRDMESGAFWSTAYQPTLKRPENYEAIFSEARAEFRRSDSDFDTHTEIVVSSEDDIELRRVRITNRSRTKRSIEVTTYGEVVLAPAINDAAHPAFSNLFIQTEIIENRQAILCHRRPRSEGEHTPWMFHLLAVHGAQTGNISYETDRMQFIGRGQTLVSPKAMQETGNLSGSHGSVLDPIVSIRHQITLNGEESVTVNIVTGIAETREGAMELIEKYQDRRLADRVFDLAWTHSQVVLRQLNLSESDGQLYARLASSVIYANPSLRADQTILLKNKRGQPDLWSYAISGDLPIVLLRIKEPDNIDLVRQLVQAHAYWRLKGLAVDLVIWNEDQGGYRQLIQDQIMGLIAAGAETTLIEKPGGIFIRPVEQISSEDRILLQSVARVIISDSQGNLADHLNRRAVREIRTAPFVPSRVQKKAAPAAGVARGDLILNNGLGGFTPDGREYVITTDQDNVTPLPWVNVIANPYFGTVISENGLSYTWLENAHEFRLTPWANDPVTDSAGEAFYIRDEETGHFWSPSPLPARGATPYATRHGFGYSVFEHSENGINSELTIYVALDAPVKISTLKIRNDSAHSRRISATGYVEWVLGDLKAKTGMHVNTEVDAKTGALFARNPYNTEFGNRVAFFDVDAGGRSLTGDRAEFLGRNGNLTNPAALSRFRLSGKVGAGLDACAAIQVPFEIGAGETREVVFRLGIGQDVEDATILVNRYRNTEVRRNAYEALCQYWKHTLGTVNVDTPDQGINMLVNGWLLYQTISCRLWGRSGYYQSGGAFGFRDQLQDTMALVHAQPLLLRKQLLLCASRQFIEGDVQHWWHPPSGRGVRTRCSDDYLWLPLATCRYVTITGDTGVLDEESHFLSGRPVSLQEDSYYDMPGRSDRTATLYEHCKKAILYGLKFGDHGLPLMGIGDWNDGMNLVGEKGRGESVWLAFFLHEVLKKFSDLARLKGDAIFAQQCDVETAKLRKNIDKSAWDGEWYRRAYFDDGTPLGSNVNSECRIDSISQSWSVLSGAGVAARTKQAMKSLEEHLVKRDDNLIQLLDPPFDKGELNPGYIKGYVPGVRENGGQYTHAAIWATMAFAKLGDSKRAWELMNMINPINHARTPEQIAVYKAEPYVVAADVYAVHPHTGRGGWTWYTGSASWLYRLITESLLGLHLTVDKLHFTPCLPADWKEYKVHYRYRETVYHITIIQDGAHKEKQTVTVDGVEQKDPFITLVEDHKDHIVEVRVGKKAVLTKSDI